MRCDPREGEEEEGRVRVQKNLIVAMNELRRRYVNYWNWVVSAAPRRLSASLFSVCLSVSISLRVGGISAPGPLLPRKLPSHCPQT